MFCSKRFFICSMLLRNVLRFFFPKFNAEIALFGFCKIYFIRLDGIGKVDPFIFFFAPLDLNFYFYPSGLEVCVENILLDLILFSFYFPYEIMFFTLSIRMLLSVFVERGNWENPGVILARVSVCVFCLIFSYFSFSFYNLKYVVCFAIEVIFFLRTCLRVHFYFTFKFSV